MRLIDADELIQTLNGKKIRYNADINEAIRKAPTVEQRKKGKWFVYDDDDDKYDRIECPICKKRFYVDAYHWCDIGFTADDLKYCPECGAEMKEEQDD